VPTEEQGVAGAGLGLDATRSKFGFIPESNGAQVRRKLRLVATAGALAVALTLALAACGGSSDSEGVASTNTTGQGTTDGAQGSGDDGSTTGGEQDPQEAALEFAKCMRDNGVPNFPDPVGGFVTDSARDLDADPAVFEAAWKACESLLPQASSGAAGNSAGSAGWEKIVPGGDCACADGSEFAFWEQKADPAKVVLFLDGGGACFDATTCAFTGSGENDFYNWSIRGTNPAMQSGIFDFANPDNPFAEYSFIYVPLCTGDSYLGDVTREYSPELTVEHNGFVNGTAALDYLAERYPGADQVVVVGKTAGSIAAPIYGGLVADLLPEAQVTVFGGQSGHFPDDPDFNAEILGERWGAYATMPDWEVNDGLTARDWGPPRFWIQAGLHDPEIVLARFDYAYDANAARALEQLGVDSSTLEMIDANEAAIEAAGVVLHSYTAPGEEHGIFDFDRFYELEVNGVRLVDWVEALLAGEPLDDVHCDECTAG
jgi:Pectinacetylesterase